MWLGGRLTSSRRADTSAMRGEEEGEKEREKDEGRGGRKRVVYRDRVSLLPLTWVRTVMKFLLRWMAS